MPPISVIFVITGIAVFVNACYFLGFGAKAVPGGTNPLYTVGWVTLTAGIVDLANCLWIIAKLFGPPVTTSDLGVRLAGLLTFYSIFFVGLGATQIKALDLRPVGNLAVVVAIAPLFWWSFFDGSWMLHSILIVWIFSFLGVTALTYGLVKAQIGGVLLMGTALYTFLVPAVILGSGHAIP